MRSCSGPCPSIGAGRSRLIRQLLNESAVLALVGAAGSQLRPIDVPGFEATPRNGVSSNTVTPGYFHTFGLALIRGRDFTTDNRQGHPLVAVVSESMAHHFFGNSDPIGRTFTFGPHAESTSIIGVVADVRQERLRADTPTRMV